MAQHNHTQDSHDQHEHHIMPFATYVKVALALFGLTILTVAAHAIHDKLGALAPIIAFGIAAVKAFLVMAWFMHLKYDKAENRIIFATGFACLILLFIISFIDIMSRIAEVSPL